MKNEAKLQVIKLCFIFLYLIELINTPEYKDITTQELRNSFSENNSIRENYSNIFYSGDGKTSGEAEVKRIKGVLEKISSYMYGEDRGVDSSSPNADAADKVVEMYYRIALYYNENNNIQLPLENLDETTIRALYDEVVKSNYPFGN